MVEITAFNEVSVALWELFEAIITSNEGLENVATWIIFYVSVDRLSYWESSSGLLDPRKLFSCNECWDEMSDMRNNKTHWLVAVGEDVLMIISLPSKPDFYQCNTEDLSYCTRRQDFYLLPLPSLLHYEFTGNQITSQLAVQLIRSHFATFQWWWMETKFLYIGRDRIQ